MTVGNLKKLDEPVPPPVIGLRADFAITPRWSLHTKTDFFYLEISDYSGAIVDTRLAVEYQPFKHVGFDFVDVAGAKTRAGAAVGCRQPSVR